MTLEWGLWTGVLIATRKRRNRWQGRKMFPRNMLSTAIHSKLLLVVSCCKLFNVRGALYSSNTRQSFAFHPNGVYSIHLGILSGTYFRLISNSGKAIHPWCKLHYKANFGLLEHWKIISIRSFYLSSCLLIHSCNWKTNSNSIDYGIECCSLFAYFLWMSQRQYNNLLILNNFMTNIFACINFQSLYIFVEHIKRLCLQMFVNQLRNAKHVHCITCTFVIALIFNMHTFYLSSEQ